MITFLLDLIRVGLLQPLAIFLQESLTRVLSTTLEKGGTWHCLDFAPVLI